MIESSHKNRKATNKIVAFMLFIDTNNQIGHCGERGDEGRRFVRDGICKTIKLYF
jgi:hypothetical protein